ncbi:MAG: lactate racemase domain-containing protein [Gemmataceae bacterium]
MPTTVAYGRKTLVLTIPEDRLVPMRRAAEPEAAPDAPALFSSAVGVPTRFPALHLALTPDDHVAVVVDRWTGLDDAIVSIAEQLREAGVQDDNVTFVGPADRDQPETFHGFKTERHDPDDQQHRSYVATTKHGRRVYLNRTVADADQVVVLSETHYDSETGTAGGPLTIFPGMADTECRNGWRELSAADLHNEAEEISWLLGTPFYVHTIAGPGDTVREVIGGAADSFTDARKALEANWKLHLDRRADTVIATISGDPDDITIADVVAALAHASKAVEPGGTVVLCFEGAPRMPQSFDRIRDSESPEAAQRGLKRDPSPDAAIAARWLKSLGISRVAVLGGWPDEVVEDLFATALTQPNQVQRIIDRGGDVVVLPDAHRLRVVIDG